MEIKDLNSELELKNESEVTLETETAATQQKETSEEDILAKRQSYSKTFLKKKGVFETKYYRTPVHVYDSETGAFVEADKQMVEAEDKKSYRNKQNDFELRFFKGSKENALFSVCKETESITAIIRPPFGESVKELVPTPTEKNTELDYADVMPNTDYRCSVVPCGVRTSILLRKAASSKRYGFRFAFNGLQCKKAENALQFFSADGESLAFTICAPYMIDAAGKYSERVSLVPYEAEDGRIDVDIVPEAGWLNDKDRAFPVRVEWELRENVADMPHIAFEESFVSADGKLEVGASPVPFHMVLPKRNEGMLRKKVELLLECETVPTTENRTFLLALNRVTVDPETGEAETKRVTTVPLTAEQTEIALDVTSEMTASESASYTLGLYEMTDGGLQPVSDSSVAQLNVSPNSREALFSVRETDGTSEEDKNTGGESGELGTIGSYQVDVVNGLLNMELKDFTWEGNRMPVSIRHSFRGQFANRPYLWKDGVTNPYANMQIGYGWRLNLMQCMVHTGIISGSNSKDTYTYIDESENEAVFTQCDCESGTCTKYEDVNGLGYVYDAATGIMNKGTEEYRFTNGKLSKITDEYGNSMTIVFDTSGRISCVTDGVNRAFSFDYEGNNLISITAPNGAVVSLAYCNNRLCCASFPNGQTVSFDYHATTGMPTSVTVTDTSVQNATPITTNFTLDDGIIVKGIATVGSNRSVQFNYVCHEKETIITEIEAADGDECPAIIRHRVLLHEHSDKNYTYYEYDNESKIKVTDTHGIVVPYTEPGMEIGNLKCQNLLSDQIFTADIQELTDTHPVGAWRTNMSYPCVQFEKPEKMPGFCSAVLINRFPTDVDKGIWQNVCLQNGRHYVFSCYLKLWRKSSSDPNSGVYLMVQSNGCSFISQRITTRGEFQRVALPFCVSDDVGEANFQVGIYIAGNVYAKVIAPQLEEGEYLSPFNYLTTRHIILGGNNVPVTVGTIKVPSGKDIKETYTLSGYISSDMDSTDFAGVNAKIYYANNEAPEENYLPLYGVRTDPTFFMVQFSKKQYREIKKIEIVLTNDQNGNAAHFTDMQLVRNCYEDGLSEEDFAGITYDETGEESEIDDRAADAPTDVESIVFEEVKDAFGNVVTSTNFQNGEFGTIYGESKYEETVGGTTDEPVHYHDDGNNKTEETDARGNATLYTNDPVTSKPKKVADRCGNETEYTYDNTGRTIGVKAANGGTVGYSYNGYDDVTAITRGDGQEYRMSYDTFRNLTAVGLKDGQNQTRNLVSYAYKAGTDRLKTVTYANGSEQTLTYDRFGNIIKEVWEKSENNEHIKEAEYRYFYDASQNLTKTVDILNGKMYNIIRRGKRITSAEEYDIVWDETDGATNPVLVGTMVYSFDGKGKQFRKKYVPADGNDEQKYVFAFKDEQNVAVQLPTGAVSHAKTDHFGRKVFDELQLGKGFLNRTFTYYDGVVSEQHEESNKRVSDPTTTLVKEIKFANGRTIQYEYDKEERITKVIDSVDGTTVYTYDALGQLKTETKGETVINSMTYDKYGNMAEKNGVAYEYDSTGAWKDLLTSVGNRTISYDANGNPTTYLGHTLTWEKGRQLKQFDTFTYKCNNEGIRIEKVENCKIHKYVLDGATILKEIVVDTCCNGNGYTNDYLYDLDGTVCGIKHNDAVFYFCKNLQGDVIAITDETGAIVARYSYDAWGKCTIDEDTSACNIASVNPFRYRGYYYDPEIGMYYLQSRYYDPEVGRFINADESSYIGISASIVGYNVFTYSENDAINLNDPTGHSASVGALILSKPILTALSSAINGIMTGISTSLASIKAAIATSWFIPLCIAAAIIAIVGIVYVVNRVVALIASALQTISAVKSIASCGGINQNDLNGYTVYIIVRNHTIDVVYVGITKRYSARKSQHKKRFPPSRFTMMPVATGLTKNEARAMEQTIITAYTLDTLCNMINSISPKKWSTFKSEFEQMSTLMQSWIDPE